MESVTGQLESVTGQFIFKGVTQGVYMKFFRILQKVIFVEMSFITPNPPKKCGIEWDI